VLVCDISTECLIAGGLAFVALWHLDKPKILPMKTSVKTTLIVIQLLVCNFVLQAQQNIQLEPLNGPSGMGIAYDLSSDTSGAVFLLASDKIFRSADNGNSWLPCNNGLNPSSLGEFIRTPDGGMIYGYFINGALNNNLLFRYDANLDKWINIKLNTGIQDIHYGFSVDAAGNYATSTLTKNSGGNFLNFLYSENEGESFVEYLMDEPLNGNFAGMATLNPQHNLYLTTIGQPGQTTYRVYHFSLDGKMDVVQNIPTSSLKASFNPYNSTAFLSSSVLKRSVDGGLTWESITIDSSLPYQPFIIDLYFESNDSIWAATSSGGYLSTDNGQSWARWNQLNTTGVRLHKIYGKDTWFHAQGICLTSEIRRTEDNGSTWTDLTDLFKYPNVTKIAQNPIGAILALSCESEKSWKSSDGGDTWENFYIDSLALPVTEFVVKDDGVMVAIVNDESMYRSKDNGITWESLAGIVGNTPPYSSPKLYVDYQGNIYFFELNKVWKSTDNGSSWIKLPVNGFTNLTYSSVAFHPNGDLLLPNNNNINVYNVQGLLIAQIPFKSSNFHCTNNGIIVFSDRFTNQYYRILDDGLFAPEPLFPPISAGSNHPNITSNRNGDIFIQDADVVLRSIDHGETWELLDTVQNTNGSTIYISPDQYLYLGFEDHVIVKSTTPSAQRNIVNGKVWYDWDSNCVFDSTDAYAAFEWITAVGNDVYSGYSDNNGNYRFTAGDGDYLLNALLDNDLFSSCPQPVSIQLNGPTDTVSVDFALQPTTLCPYLSVRLSAPIVRRCFDVTYTIQYKNEGTATATGAYVDVRLDSFYIFQNASLPVASQNGLTYRFDLGDLQPNQAGSFQLTVKVSCDAALGQTHCMSADIYPNDLCLPTLEQIGAYRECRENIGSYDPNDKQAFVNGHTAPGYVLPNTDVEYLIRFQNTGTDTAFRVVIEDRLPALLDVSSIVPLVASHAYTMTLDARNTLRFVFDNILLPDSNINEAASHGFVKFRVAQQPDVSLGSVIRNSADIFFDFNAPVRTNESRLTVGTVSIRPEPGNPYTISAYPNPFTDAVAFEISGPDLSGEKILRLVDALGRTIRQEAFSGHQLVLTRQGLQPGVYYFLIDGADGRIGGGTVVVK
jgi:uncharacterized repeat protein (TIGR01451 family)